MRLRLLSPADLADEAGFARVAAAGDEDPLPGIGPEKLREELAARRIRPEWIGLAEDEEGRPLARALWWGRADGELPVALDCLRVSPAAAEAAGTTPEELGAALLALGHESFGRRPEYNLMLAPDWHEREALREGAAWRRAAAARGGLGREIERLRFEWTPETAVPAPAVDAERPGPVFRPGTDDEFREVFARVAAGSLDLHTRGELARGATPEEIAADDLAFYEDCPGERSWWRLALLPDGETVAGFTVPSATPYARNVGYIGVVPEQRGRGLIHPILAETVRVHRESGAERITATTDAVNVPMAAAFEKAGFTVTERRLIWERQD
ncbi:GNAT family N-acetyltransferase [Streptomyces sp. BI20]|uniref:GNAT family N-acetyltransferase n=1 Tax=Streptomyces sp. BI20 TaxID=3403460 RepID=UPI003C793CE6